MVNSNENHNLSYDQTQYARMIEMIEIYQSNHKDIYSLSDLKGNLGMLLSNLECADRDWSDEFQMLINSLELIYTVAFEQNRTTIDETEIVSGTLSSMHDLLKSR